MRQSTEGGGGGKGQDAVDQARIRSAYLRGGPGAPFSVAAASPPALVIGPLLPRHARGSAALLIAESRRPRWTLLGGDRGGWRSKRVKVAVQRLVGGMGTTRNDTTRKRELSAWDAVRWYDSTR